jgi:DNA polymerase IV
VEEFSIDEAFCDITGLRRLYRTSYADIARMIKSRIQKELDITVSVGISLTKTLAKIASRHSKPDGFTQIPGRRLHVFLGDIPLERVCGFGPNTVALLNKCGIHKVLDYVKRPAGFAEKLLGKTGIELWHELRGTPIYSICQEVKDKYLTISKTKTFSPPSRDKDFVKAQLMRNLESAFIKLRRHGLAAKELAVYLRKSDFDGCALAGSLDRHSPATLDFTTLCSELFSRLFREGAEYRATGIVLADIVSRGVDSRTLFDDPARIAKIAGISKSVDEINSVYGKYAVHLAATDPALSPRTPHPRNDHAWRKTKLLKGETFRNRLRIPLLKLV